MVSNSSATRRVIASNIVIAEYVLAKASTSRGRSFACSATSSSLAETSRALEAEARGVHRARFDKRRRDEQVGRPVRAAQPGSTGAAMNAIAGEFALLNEDGEHRGEMTMPRETVSASISTYGDDVSRKSEASFLNVDTWKGGDGKSGVIGWAPTGRYVGFGRPIGRSFACMQGKRRSPSRKK